MNAASGNSGSSRLARTGWMWKRGQRRKNWKKRWHVIDPKEKCLRYFDKETQAANPDNALGEISLIQASVLNATMCREEIGDEVDKFGQGSCFGVRSGDRTLYVSVEDPNSRAEWVRMLGYICRSSGGQSVKNESAANTSGGDEHDFVTVEMPSRREMKPWSAGKPYSHTRDFLEYRKSSTRAYENVAARLKNRVARLIGDVPSSFLSQEKFERDVVPWQDGSTCTHCRNQFGTLKHRKSNCRTCGRVTCTDAACSDICELSMMATFLGLDPRGTRRSTRICCACITEIERTKAQRNITPGTGAFLKLYSKIVENKATADERIDSFNQMTSSKRRPTADEQLRIKEVKAEIDKCFQTIQAASTMMVNQPSAQSGHWQTVTANVKDACNKWQQPRSSAMQSRLV